MPDCFDTRIRIGGRLSASGIEGLYEAMDRDEVGFDWGEYHVESLAELVEEIEKGGALDLCGSDLAWGRTESVEAFCREHGLTYARWCEAKYEYDAEVHWWSPGMEAPEEAITTQEGEPVLKVSEIEEGLQADTFEEKVSSITGLIAQVSPPEIPPLGIDHDV